MAMNCTGVLYFPITISVLEGIALELIEAHFGLKGVAAFIKLLCKVYKEEGYYMSWGGCVKMLAQPFFMRKAQTFPSPGFVITQSLCNFRHQFFRYGKVTFSFLHSQPNRSFSTKN